MPDRDELSGLRAENVRLIALLESHGIQRRSPNPVVLVAREPEPSKLSTSEKVALFRRLFRGRTDVYPIRWEGKTSGKTGYAPACANEWRTGVCEKPRIKCGDCSNRLLIPLSRGYSLPAAFQRVMPAAWARPSSPIPALALGN